MKICVDYEFNIVNDEKKRKMPEMISIGAVAFDNTGKVYGEFYKLVKPVNYTILTEECMSITNITQEEVDNARSLEFVLSKYFEWINIVGNGSNNIKVYNWGSYDKSALKKISKYEYTSNEQLKEAFEYYIKSSINIQNKVCSNIVYNNEIVNKCIGLQNMKRIFMLEGEVKHNALSDAIDLKNVYIYSRSKDRVKEALDLSKDIIKEMYDKEVKNKRFGNIDINTEITNLNRTALKRIKEFNGLIESDPNFLLCRNTIRLNKTKYIKFSDVVCSIELIHAITPRLKICLKKDKLFRLYNISITKDNKDKVKTFLNKYVI